MTASPEEKTIRLGFLELAPGVSKLNCWTLFVASFATIGVLTFISISTAYVLNENLGIPASEHGRISGDLVFLTEVTQILLFGALGVYADRIGRRPIFIFGMIGMGVGYLLYPYADSIVQLSMYRVVYAAGLAAATGMLGTVVADYPTNPTRGKMLAVVGVLNGIGVVFFALVFGRIPDALVNAGYSGIEAGRLTHWLLFGFCAIVAIVYRFGLKPGVPLAKELRPSYQTLVVAGLRQAKKPRIALSYAAAFIARSDLVILGTFLVLWGTTAGVAQGMETAEATKAGSIIFATSQSAALFWAPVIGFVLDRINRVTGLILCMGLASIGYSSMVFVGDPLSPDAMPYFVLLGIGQISAFFGATTLIGQEAPTAERGAVVGLFNMSGAIGILICSGVGGRIFDMISPNATFVFIGGINFLVLIFALFVRRSSPGPMSTKNFDPLIQKVKSLGRS